MRSKFSLLSKRESKRSLRQAIFFSLLTIVLIVLVIVYGIPAIIKMAVFFGNINSSSTPIESKNKIPPSPPIFKSTFDATNSAKLSLSGFSRYFFFNESTVPLLVQGQKILREGVASLEAKIIAGIDDKANLVLEFRMDKYGNCMVKKYPLKALQRSINEGIFRGEIIRNGD